MSSFENNNHVGWLVFDNKRKLLKYKFSLEDKIESLNEDIISASGKQDYSMSKRFNKEKKELTKELDILNTTLDEYKQIENYYSNFNEDFNEFYSQFNNFEDEDYLILTEDVSHVFNLLNMDSPSVLSIGRNISCDLNDSDVKKIISNLYFDNEDDENNDTYISLFYAEFENYHFPLFYIPVVIENPYDYKIFRNYNKKIIINPFFEEILNAQYDEITDENFQEIVNKLSEHKDIQINEEICLKNYDFSKLQVFYDLDYEKWKNYLTKLNLIQKSDGIFTHNEVLEINNSISMRWPALNLSYQKGKSANDSLKVIKNLLAMNYSVLFISNGDKKINQSLINSNIGPLVLDFDLCTDLNSFLNQFDRKLLTSFDQNDDKDLITQKRNLRDLIKVLKDPYLNYEMQPIKIKTEYDYYSDIIDEPIEIPFVNMPLHDKEYYDKCNDDILKLIDKSKNFTNFSELFNISFRKESYIRIKNELQDLENMIDKFKVNNLFLNKNSKIKIFDNLEEASYLVNLSVLNKEYQYIKKEDFEKLNKFLKRNIDNNFNDISSYNELHNFTMKLSDLQLKLLDFNENLNRLYDNHENLSFLNQNINLIEEIMENIENLDFDKLNIDEEDIVNNYLKSDDDILTTLENHVMYSELIEYNIIQDESIFNSHLSTSNKRIEILYQLYKYLLKKLNEINNFFIRNNYLNISEELFDKNISFDKLRQNINRTILHLDELNQINGSNYPKIVRDYVNLFIDLDLDESTLENIFYYNFFKSLYAQFLSEYPQLKDIGLDYEPYEAKLDKIDKNLWDWQYNNFMHEIYKNASEISQKTKDDFSNFLSIDSILNEFKEEIMKNKKIFMMDFSTMYEYIDSTFESSFDYVIVDSMDELDQGELLSLLLRSKNKIICL